MKYSIMGFQQEKLIEYGLDLSDVCILKYIIDAQSSPLKHHSEIVDDEVINYVWITRNKLINDLPVLNITEKTLTGILTTLRKKELISSVTLTNQNVKGTQTYYRITEKTYEMMYDRPLLKNEQWYDRPLLKNEQSNNIINNNISKDIFDNTLVNTNVLTDLRNREIILDNNTNTKQFNKYDYVRELCKKEIENYTQDEKLKESLCKFLDMRVETWKETPKSTLSLTKFKAYLKKLDTLDYKLEVVIQSTRNRWNTFYEVKSIYGKPKKYDKNVSSETFNATDIEEIEKWRKENNVQVF